MTRTTILLIDDDPLLRRSLQRALQQAGYAVLPLPDGGEALRHLREETLPEVALVLSDVEMPGADGYKVADAFAAARPDVPVVLMSGRVRRADVLAKPFTTLTLLRAIKQALADAEAAIQAREADTGRVTA